MLAAALVDSSTVNTIVAAVTATVLAGIAHFTARLVTNRKVINEDIVKAWPTIRTALPAASQFTGLNGRVSALETSVSQVPSGLAQLVAEEVQKEFKTLFPKLFSSAADVVSNGVPASPPSPPVSPEADPAAS